MNNINILLSGTFYSGELSVGKKRRVGGWLGGKGIASRAQLCETFF